MLWSEPTYQKEADPLTKKTLCLLLAVCLLLCSLMGCSGEELAPTTEAPQPTTTEATTQATTEAATEATTAPTTVPTTAATTEGTTGPQIDFSLDWKSLSLNVLGETFFLYSGDVDPAEITWLTDDPKVATFNYGIVTAIGPGETTVHAEYMGVRDSCTVHCIIKETVPPETTTPVSDPREPVLLPPAYQNVSNEFFADAVFVGDSITEGLRNYCQWNGGGLSVATFLTRVSYGVYNELYGGFHVVYNDVSMPIEDAIAATGAKKLFIMLGINDLGNSGVDKTISYWPILLERIREKNPEITIYVQSIAPVYTGGEYQGVNNSNVRSYNSRLQQVAKAHGCQFIDVCQYLVDHTGGLAAAYTSDRYVHLSNEGFRTWIKVLYGYTGYVTTP